MTKRTTEPLFRLTDLTNKPLSKDDQQQFDVDCRLNTEAHYVEMLEKYQQHATLKEVNARRLTEYIEAFQRDKGNGPRAYELFKQGVLESAWMTSDPRVKEVDWPKGRLYQFMTVTRQEQIDAAEARVQELKALQESDPQ